MKLWNKSQHLKTKKHQLNNENGKPIKKEKYYKECDLEKLKLKVEKLNNIIQELEPVE
jgi:gamma-glutamyl phosphate reductase